MQFLKNAGVIRQFIRPQFKAFVAENHALLKNAALRGNAGLQTVCRRGKQTLVDQSKWVENAVLHPQKYNFIVRGIERIEPPDPWRMRLTVFFSAAFAILAVYWQYIFEIGLFHHKYTPGNLQQFPPGTIYLEQPTEEQLAKDDEIFKSMVGNKGEE